MLLSLPLLVLIQTYASAISSAVVLQVPTLLMLWVALRFRHRGYIHLVSAPLSVISASAGSIGSTVPGTGS